MDSGVRQHAYAQPRHGIDKHPTWVYNVRSWSYTNVREVQRTNVFAYDWRQLDAVEQPNEMLAGALRLGKVRPRTLRQAVVDALQKAILSGRLEPGKRLVEAELASGWNA